MENQFKVGDKVQYCHTSCRGNSINFSTREGVIIEIVGKYISVKASNGRRTLVPASGIKLQGEKSHCTEIVEAMAAAHKNP